MQNILFVLSSPRGWESHSHQIARRIVDDLKSRHPAARVIVRDVAKDPLPHVGEAFGDGRWLPPENRSPAQARALAVSDVLIDELMAAEVIVLAVPMHNFSVPSTLKTWIDHVVLPRRTVAFSEQGAEGLLKGKQAIVVVSRGGVYSDGPMKQFDFQETYLRSVLGFIGITDVHVVRVEGVAMGADTLKNALASAHAQAEGVVREIASRERGAGRRAKGVGRVAEVAT